MTYHQGQRDEPSGSKIWPIIKDKGINYLGLDSG